MCLDLAAPNDDIGTFARDTVDGHEDERGSRLEDVCIGWHLRNMVDDRAVLVDGIGAVQLEGALTHVHGVGGPTWADDHDLSIVGGGVGGTRIGGGRNGDVEVTAAVGKAVRDTGRDRTVC